MAVLPVYPQHVSGLPERLKIFLCWPKAWVDNAYTEEVSTPNKKRVSAPPLTQEEERAAHTATMRRMVASLKQVSEGVHSVILRLSLGPAERQLSL